MSEDAVPGEEVVQRCDELRGKFPRSAAKLDRFPSGAFMLDVTVRR